MCPSMVSSLIMLMVYYSSGLPLSCSHSRISPISGIQLALYAWWPRITLSQLYSLTAITYGYNLLISMIYKNFLAWHVMLIQ